MRCFVLGNGPSLLETPWEKLKGERTYAVNHIWKLFDKTDWRPTVYVRGELPSYNEQDVIGDFQVMRQHNVSIRYQKGFEGHVFALCNHGEAKWGDFRTCKGLEPHDWHLPLVCGYGTVVTTAIQLAVLDGATEIYLLGCDLGGKHFHEGEFTGEELAHRSHEIAAKCSPVPIYNATPGGFLDVYPRERLW